MTHDISIAADLDELKSLFGPPPILSTESEEAYYAIMAGWYETVRPTNFLEKMLVRDLTNYTWDEMRFTRHKTLGIDRRFRQRLEIEAKRTKMISDRKEAQVEKESPSTSANVHERMFEIEWISMGSVEEIDAILDRKPVELDHARAMEHAIGYYERLDELSGTARERRNDTLEQIDLYRASLEHQKRRSSDIVIDAEVVEPKQDDVEVVESDPDETPLVPSSEEQK